MRQRQLTLSVLGKERFHLGCARTANPSRRGKRRDCLNEFICVYDCVGICWTVQLMGGVHHFLGKGRRGIPDQGNVKPIFHRVSPGGLDAGVGKEADQDHMRDTMLPKLLVKIGIRKAALRPMFLDDDVALPGREVGMPVAAPFAARE